MSATGGDNGAGIGSGWESADVAVHIAEGTVNVEGGSHGAGIGNGKGNTDDVAILATRGVKKNKDPFPVDQIKPLGVELGQTGTIDITGGSVRLSLENAKWIYDHFSKGTIVYSF